MSWHRESDGTIVVNKDCEDLVHTNVQFQMGTMRRHDGKLIVIDNSILYLCGKEKKPMRVEVEIEVADYGVIRVKLDREKAPITVDNFLKLVEDTIFPN